MNWNERKEAEAVSARMLREGHTEDDFRELIAAGVDPASTQPRERAVPCWVCLTPTWNQAGACSNPAHYEPPARAQARTVLSIEGREVVL